jgi:translocator protein
VTVRATDLLGAVVAILICQMAGIIGSAFTASSIPIWYAELEKPTFNPPNWVFAPVWTTLYAMMGMAAFLIWRQRGAVTAAPDALALFGLQLVLNALWSPVFFGAQAPLGGLVIIIALWLSLLATIVAFWRITPAAGALLVPYLLWVSFATVLNYSIWQLN